MMSTIEKIKQAIFEDEREYCFDRSYCSDEAWEEFHGDETREEAYSGVVTYWEDSAAKGEGWFFMEVKDVFGDKYDYLMEKV